MSTQEHTHGNKIWPHKPGDNTPDVRKQPADSVPFGTDICTRGNSVWCAYDGDVLIAVSPTSDEARRKWRLYMARKSEQEAAAKREKGSSAKC
jgi:hypothetical protein